MSNTTKLLCKKINITCETERFNHHTPYMEDWEVREWLRDYDDEPFKNLPEGLKTELKTRNLDFGRRAPSISEQNETVEDAYYHRVATGNLTQDDFIDYLKGKRSIQDV